MEVGMTPRKVQVNQTPTFDRSVVDLVSQVWFQNKRQSQRRRAGEELPSGLVGASEYYPSLASSASYQSLLGSESSGSPSYYSPPQPTSRSVSRNGNANSSAFLSPSLNDLADVAASMDPYSSSPYYPSSSSSASSLAPAYESYGSTSGRRRASRSTYGSYRDYGDLQSPASPLYSPYPPVHTPATPTLSSLRRSSSSNRLSSMSNYTTQPDYGYPGPSGLEHRRPSYSAPADLGYGFGSASRGSLSGMSGLGDLSLDSPLPMSTYGSSRRSGRPTLPPVSSLIQEAE